MIFWGGGRKDELISVLKRGETAIMQMLRKERSRHTLEWSVASIIWLMSKIRFPWSNADVNATTRSSIYIIKQIKIATTLSSARRDRT